MPILRRARAKGADPDDVRSDLPQGTLDLLILKVLAPEPLHGYAIAQRLQQVSRDVVQVQQGTLYPALHRLEQRGYLSAYDANAPWWASTAEAWWSIAATRW